MVTKTNFSATNKKSFSIAHRGDYYQVNYWPVAKLKKLIKIY